MADDQRAELRCDQCGQTDDHPKVHLGEVTKHHDCLSADEDAMVRGSSATAGKIIDECKAGKRGPDLLKRIGTLHKGN
jgi:hypothetical protein